MRVVIDTNVLMSGIFFGGVPWEVLRRFSEGQVELALSLAILRPNQQPRHLNRAPAAGLRTVNLSITDSTTKNPASGEIPRENLSSLNPSVHEPSNEASRLRFPQPPTAATPWQARLDFPPSTHRGAEPHEPCNEATGPRPWPRTPEAGPGTPKP